MVLSMVVLAGSASETVAGLVSPPRCSLMLRHPLNLWS